MALDKEGKSTNEGIFNSLKNFSIDEASWVTQAQFIQLRLLTKFIEDDQPVEEK